MTQVHEVSHRRLLLLSSSMVEGVGYLEYAAGEIKDFLGTKVKRVLFFPFAGIVRTFDEYSAQVRERFEAMGYELDSVHKASDARAAVENAEAIVIGGGNTFHLLSKLYEANLIESLRERVLSGTPYIGWSAGSNVACPTIKTTNDMPVVEPPSLNALNLVPFQINPHYTNVYPKDFHGETREGRLLEFIKINPNVYVVGLREGSMLRIEGSEITLRGEREARVFKSGREAREYGPMDSLEFLL